MRPFMHNDSGIPIFFGKNFGKASRRHKPKRFARDDPEAPWNQANAYGEHPGDQCCRRASGGMCHEHNWRNYPTRVKPAPCGGKRRTGFVLSKARIARAIVKGLNESQWDKLRCCGAQKDKWLAALFDYLKRQGGKLS